jgi:hypothetical protein
MTTKGGLNIFFPVTIMIRQHRRKKGKTRKREREIERERVRGREHKTIK